MVYLDTSVPYDMAKSADLSLKQKQINHRSKRTLSDPACEQSCFAIVDVVILIAVVGSCGFLLYPYIKVLAHKTGSCGFLLYPYIKVLAHKTVEYGEEVMDVISEEIFHAPFVFGVLGLSILITALILVAVSICTDNSCGKPGCRGLSKAAEFDIQLETEDCVKNSSASLSRSGLKKGLFELPRDYHTELESELKKMAPPNGRAVLVFRARCGCSVGRMEVPGPRKVRKVKK